MRRLVVVVVAVLLTVAACGEAEESAAEIGDRWTEAWVQGDDAAVRELFADDAVFMYQDSPEEPVWGEIRFAASYFASNEDFDGDGEVTLGDRMQADYAFSSLFLEDVQWECSDVASGVADCSGTETTRFEPRAWPWEYQVTVEDGQIAVLERTSDYDQDAHASFMRGLDAYRAWIREHHPDSYDEMFEQALPVMMPECIELHANMVEEYFAAAEA